MADEEEVIQDGSEDHPWLANSYAQMVDYLKNKTSAGGGHPCWVRLTTDINCNEACPEGWTTIVMENNLDMYGHKIIAPLIKDGNSLFHGYWNNVILTIKDGYILNVYENYTSTGNIFSSGYDAYGIRLNNIQINLFLRNINVCFGYTSEIKNCRIGIKGKFYPNGNFFSIYSTIDSNIFELNYTSSNVSKMLFSGGYDEKQINNCLFTGTVDNFNLGSNYQGTDKIGCGSFVNCIIAVKTSNTVNYGYYPYGNNLISSETKGMIFNTVYGGTIETLTDDQLKSLTAVQATQFYVATPPANTSSGGT